MAEIIIQETDEAILDVLKMALNLEGFEVETVLNYEYDFLALIQKTRPHVVMLDYVLDGKISIQIGKRIREKYPNLPIIALSCNSNIHEEYSKHGFDDYIPKPFDLDLLFSILRKYIPKKIEKII